MAWLLKILKRYFRQAGTLAIGNKGTYHFGRKRRVLKVVAEVFVFA
ncbi:hypothetical protein HNQ92_003278 [Rhabdobacter roseus]|uniref:Uncharacterized protein n=1 Tax=Rhabdobacter roseus TaxID=1655419 RepID=A0A840TZ08_9BACT|nr:hypothetical protein [Rhabdobacter roseus]MBB5285130.1 hypothetical protein [Rhabdobacter roseus]